MAGNMLQPWWLYLLTIFWLRLDSKLVGLAFQPEFAEPLSNLTVPIGRDATFRCLVQNLGGYRVGWVKADTKAIQAIHVHVITNNHRVGVSHNGQAIWNLHIKNVQEEDRGQYMCQINTDPMKSQMGYLDVVIPPDFILDETSGDIMVSEGGTARVSCRARGQPLPRVMWRREDGEDIVIRYANGSKTKVSTYEDSVLTLHKISRSEMGAYLCIASNGIPPSISKRIIIKVHFHPVIQVPNQLVGAPLGTDVTLECYVEASPKSINYWIRDSSTRGALFPLIPLRDAVYSTSVQHLGASGTVITTSMKWAIPTSDEMVISSNKYEVANTMMNSFESRMTLTVRRLEKDDVGGYRCVAKNSLGEVDSVIRLYDIPGPGLVKDSSTVHNREEYKYSTTLEGSAERSDDEDEKETSTDIFNWILTNSDSLDSLNRTEHFSRSNAISKFNLNNKVHKIVDKLSVQNEKNKSIRSYSVKLLIVYFEIVTLFFVV